MPLSSLWEGTECTDFDIQFFDFLYESRQIELISDCATVEEFLERSMQLYYYDRVRYGCYFNNTARYIKYIPTVFKGKGATLGIKNLLEKWEISKNIPICLPQNDKINIEINKITICEINRNSEERGITKSLFEDKMANKIHELSVARLLSSCYIKDYCKFIKGDIATNVDIGIIYYDILAHDYPFNDISVLEGVLECAGIGKDIFGIEKNNEWFVFLYHRHNAQHERICKYIDNIIINCYSSLKNSRNIKISSNEILVYLKRAMSNYSDLIVHINSIMQMDAFEKNLEVVLKCICGQGDSIKNKYSDRRRDKEYYMKDNKKVFVVHGHDELLKEKVSNWLYELELSPIVLHKKANVGTDSIISKIEKYSDVRCAIILLTADDKGKDKNIKKYNYRARQNVVFEAGYFIGKLGCQNVILLHENEVEIPGDLGGCVYIPINGEEWKEQIRIEFNEMGINYKK